MNTAAHLIRDTQNIIDLNIKPMNFGEAVAYLYSLGNEVETMKLGLATITKVLTALGDPHKRYTKVQVAGTNGKGSVCAFLDSILIDAGIRTGRFTSPHLISITERIKVAGEDIGEAEFAAAATRVRTLSEALVADGELELVPTYFEQVTAMGLLAFADAGVEIAILETGLGGRLDATTAANAEYAAITRIDLDHQRILGQTLSRIAGEKAAIIRRDSKVVIGLQEPSADAVVEERCAKMGVEPVRVRDIGLTRSSDSPAAYTFTTTTSEYADIELRMSGTHQLENAAVAIAVAELISQNGRSVPADSIVRGLANARHDGRLEWLNGVLLDGAHNASGAEALAKYLDELGRKPVTLIFGAMRDKSVIEILATLAPRVNDVIFTKVDSTRALEPRRMWRMMPAEFDHDRVQIIHSPHDALSVARKMTGPDGIVLVTGSLYLVGEIRGLLTSDRPANSPI